MAITGTYVFTVCDKHHTVAYIVAGLQSSVISINSFIRDRHAISRITTRDIPASKFL